MEEFEQWIRERIALLATRGEYGAIQELRLAMRQARKSFTTLKEQPVCAFCGAPATCHGTYGRGPEGYACDTCCGHACEDGECLPLTDSSKGD